MQMSRALWVLISFGLLTSCESPTEVAQEIPGETYSAKKQASQPVDNPDREKPEFTSADTRQGLAILRRVTARYHRSQAAVKDGFIPVEPCQENPDGPGALGIPYLNPDRLDGVIDIENPEVLFYEPQKNGRLRLVGVETVVPIDQWEESDPPSLFGEEFHRNEEAGLFGRHIWIWRHNSDGVFSFWHPDVTCEYAE